jgi:hypothetical protein
METNEIQKKEIDQVMEIDGNVMAILNETRKWTKFLSIVGFVAIGFMLIMGLMVGTVMDSLNEYQTGSAMPISGGFLGFTYVIVAVIYFFPVWFLFKFSNHIKTALYFKNQEALYTAFNNLKYHYKFVGILTIVGILIAIASIIGVGIFAALAI